MCLNYNEVVAGYPSHFEQNGKSPNICMVDCRDGRRAPQWVAAFRFRVEEALTDRSARAPFSNCSNMDRPRNRERDDGPEPSPSQDVHCVVTLAQRHVKLRVSALDTVGSLVKLAKVRLHEKYPSDKFAGAVVGVRSVRLDRGTPEAATNLLSMRARSSVPRRRLIYVIGKQIWVWTLRSEMSFKKATSSRRSRTRSPRRTTQCHNRSCECL